MNPKSLPEREEILQQLSAELDIAISEFSIQIARVLDSLEKQGGTKEFTLRLAIQCARFRDLVELEIERANRAREAGHR